jgi:hypothetical protein
MDAGSRCAAKRVDANTRGDPVEGILKFFGSVIGIIFLIGLVVVIGLLMLIF